jgi:DNA-binding GntR family transcriptional regulator
MKHELLSRGVYDRLFEALVDGRLVPGDQLKRRRLAADLGVSVTPVAEAILQLEAEGFLETSPRQGTIVKPITARQVLGRFRLRRAIEIEAARTYAGASIRRRLGPLRAVAARLDAQELENPLAWRLEVEFHGGLVETAGCPVLRDTFAQVMRHGLYHAAQRLLPGGNGGDPADHVTLLERLARATPAQAQKLIERHLDDWINCLTEAAARESPDDVRPIAFVRGEAASLKRSRRRRRTLAATAFKA